jgi:uncharacterized membrane protein YfcA
VGTVSFYRRGLLDWRKGSWIAALVALGTIVGFSNHRRGQRGFPGRRYYLGSSPRPRAASLQTGSLASRKRRNAPPVQLGPGECLLRAIGVYAGLVVLGSGFFMLAALVLLTGCDLRHGNALKAFILLVVGLQSLLIFGESREVDWAADLPLALGSTVGAYLAAKLATQEWARVWVYRLLVLVVVLAIVHLILVDTEKFLPWAVT